MAQQQVEFTRSNPTSSNMKSAQRWDAESLASCDYKSFDLTPILEEYFENYRDSTSEELMRWRNGENSASITSTADVRFSLLKEFPDDGPDSVYQDKDAIHNEVHPMFDRSRFVTHLPMDEVHSIFQPAFALATEFLTNDRALTFFAHVANSRLENSKSCPPFLRKPKGPITSAMILKTKEDLLKLADMTQISFNQRGSGFSASASYSISFLIEDLGREPEVIKAVKEWENSFEDWNQDVGYFRPFILLSIDFFYEAMRLRYCQTTSGARRNFQFLLAKILLHEVAHLFISWNHWSAPCEPLIFSTDAVCEGGYSWEQFMFGSLLNVVNDVMISQSMESEFTEPRYSLCSYVPQTWVDQWFTRGFWDKFDALHESGMLLAPSPDRDVKKFMVARFCVHAMEYFYQYVVDGTATETCCAYPHCSTNKPESWPSDPVGVRRACIKAITSDQEATLALAGNFEPMYAAGYKREMKWMKDRADYLKRMERRKSRRQRTKAKKRKN